MISSENEELLYGWEKDAKIHIWKLLKNELNR